MKEKKIDFTKIMKKTVEQVYQKKTPLEHILLRPDSYVGSVEKETSDMYVSNGTKIEKRRIDYAPGLYKIFDEIIVNAADNKIRDKTMTKIEVTVKDDVISVFNDGRGVPVVIHDKEKVYVPEMIFGQLMTSSNYDDNEKKVTGGRNGFGAKLCNIFSTDFLVETSDRKSKKSFKMRFRNNMGVREEPELGPAAESDFTRITFKPDLKRFGMSKLEDDFIALIQKRVMDLSGTVEGVSVILNGNTIECNGFADYTKLYTNQDVIMGKFGRWQIGVCCSEDDQFQQVSFVNSICTSKGGTHVNYVCEKLINPIIESVKKKEKSLVLRPFQVKNALFVFVNCLIENPAFESQAKDTLTLKSSLFGSELNLSADFIKKVVETVQEKVISFAKAKQSVMLKKTDGSKKNTVNVDKLTDAKYAGHKAESKNCTLILTEGDSAKALVMAGLSTAQLHYYGVYPLKGKLLNVREASSKQIAENDEIKDIKKIIGLQHNKVYEDVSTLRYGHVMIMTDQDYDGSHIKGLIINFFDFFFPSLLKINGFLQEFITPILKVFKKKEDRKNGIPFFTIPEYEEWKDAQLRVDPDAMKKYDVKYYKGLGTSNNQEAKEYFKNLNTHVKTFLPMGDDDKMSIDLAFNKKKADGRKNWLKNFKHGTFLDTTRDKIFINEFVDRELILFSLADNIRSIPSVIDGLKPGQRKVIYTMFSSGDTKEIKVVQLAGKVAEKSAYHHGEASLSATIVNLAQNFVGSNNINLLLPNGQFGSRLQGGKDAASPRYIYTALNKLTRLLFKQDDDALLDYITEDNQKIEPTYYIPIIPMVLVNGSDGIGTGWSTNIPCFCARQICSIFLELLGSKNEIVEACSVPNNLSTSNNTVTNIDAITDVNASIDVVDTNNNVINTASNPTINNHNDIFTVLAKKLKPHYNNFKGEIEEIDDKKYKVNGVWNITDGIITITELPIGTWTEPYKSFLTRNMGEKDYGDLNTDKRIFFRFETSLSGAQAEKKLKLSTSLSLNNMVCFNKDGYIRKYDLQDILREFYFLRLKFYSLRYQHLISVLRKRLVECESRVRFIYEVVNNTLVVMKRKKSEIVLDLQSKNYPSMDGYDYLLDMSIASLTLERIESLNKEHAKKKEELEDLLKKTPKQLWIEDLNLFVKEYEIITKKIESEYDDERKVDVKFKKKAIRKGNVTKKVEITKKGKKGDDDIKKKGKKEVTQKEVKKKGVRAGNEKPLSDTKKGKKVEEKGKKAVKKVEQKTETVDSDSESVQIKRKKKSSEGKKPWEKLNYFLDSSEKE